MANVLYIHGMGGGADSRIPSILQECFTYRQPALHPASSAQDEGVSVVCRTYEFDPEIAYSQIASWIEELHPVLIIGESLGSLHAIRIKGIPHLFVSPALNTPFYFEILAWLSLIPGVTWIFDRIYKPREGDRQPLHFTFRTLRKYMKHRREALKNSSSSGSPDNFFAFFGSHDHYRRSGIVSIRTWEKYFGKTYVVYDGTHFMEDEYIRTLLYDKVVELLKISE